MFKIDFIGLVCFFIQKDGSRLALLPDGRDPGQGIDAHLPRLIVASENVMDGDGWGRSLDLIGPVLSFDLPRCTMEIAGLGTAQDPVELDTSEHTVPRLNDIDMNFEIDPDRADAVVKLPIRRGSLHSYRRPNDDNPTPAVISQLEVSHDGNIAITVQPGGDEPPRFLTLKPESEIAIVNASRPAARVVTLPPPHFLIYERLADRPVSLAGPVDQLAVPGLSELPTNHPLFGLGGIIGSGVECGNTGCCPPKPGG